MLTRPNKKLHTALKDLIEVEAYSFDAEEGYYVCFTIENGIMEGYIIYSPDPNNFHRTASFSSNLISKTNCFEFLYKHCNFKLPIMCNIFGLIDEITKEVDGIDLSYLQKKYQVTLL